jgi:DNA-binding CsgD family transcriptional regulator
VDESEEPSAAAEHDLVDRESELKALELVLDEARMSAAQLVMVHGAAGTGKTALLAAAGQLARRQGFRVLSAKAAHPGQDSPLGVVQRMFRSLAEGGLPELDEACAELAAEGPLVLLVDDVQRADAGSMQWLATVPWRLSSLPVVVVTSVGTGEPATDLAALDELAASASAELRLGALSEQGCARLVEAALQEPLEPAFAAAAVALTGANPQMVRALAATAAAAGVAPTAEGAAILSELDYSHIAPAVRARTRRVSVEAWALTRTLAVLGDGATIVQLAAVSGADEAALGEAARALTRLGLLRTEGNGLSFAQPMLRVALVRELSFTTLQSMHGQAARLLWESHARPDEIAAHLLHCQPIGEPWAVQALRAAARDAVGDRRPVDALPYLRRALAEPMADDDRAALLMDLAEVPCVDVHAAIGRLTAASHLDVAPAIRVEVVSRLAKLLVLADQRPAAEQVLAEARAALAEDPEHDGVLAVQQVTVALEESSGLHAAQSVLAELAERAGHLPAPAQRELDGLLALYETWSGRDRRQAQAYAEQALLGAPADDELDGYLHALEALLYAGQPDRVRLYADRAMRAQQHHHRPLALAAIQFIRSRTSARLGRLTEAIADAKSGIALLEAAQAPAGNPILGRHRANLADLLIEQDSLDEAAALLHGPAEGYPPVAERSADFLLARGRLAVAAGDHEAAVTDFTSCGRLLTGRGIVNPAILPWRSHAACAFAALGEMDEAIRHAAEELNLARQWGAPAAIGRAMHVYGLVCGGTRGITLLEESLELLKEAQAPLDLARASTDLGAALNRAGERPAARVHLRTALKLSQQSCAPALGQHVRTELAAAGGRLRRGAEIGVDSLTRAEHNVAVMALGGRTNRQIAEALFLQQRTVEIHLTNVYRKLCITGRAQLARAFESTPAMSS